MATSATIRRNTNLIRQIPRMSPYAHDVLAIGHISDISDRTEITSHHDVAFPEWSPWQFLQQ